MRIDFATVGGLVLALGGILGGLLLEGGRIRDVAQITAALIVLLGTAGAVLVATPPAVLIEAIKRLPQVFVDTTQDAGALINQIVDFTTQARRQGIVSLEQSADAIQEPFMRKALNLAVDGTDIQELRKMMEIDMNLEEHRIESAAKVYEAAGGYAPTVGIIGAVLGLIQVMKHLENIEEVGRGIAVAFVATVYGVASANLFLLPASHKIKSRAQLALQHQELMLDGVLGIVEGLNPKLIRTKLQSYVQSQAPHGRRQTDDPAKAGSSEPAAVEG
jgi:chemotaxis protein MotA